MLHPVLLDILLLSNFLDSEASWDYHKLWLGGLDCSFFTESSQASIMFFIWSINPFLSQVLCFFSPFVLSRQAGNNSGRQAGSGHNRSFHGHLGPSITTWIKDISQTLDIVFAK